MGGFTSKPVIPRNVSAGLRAIRLNDNLDTGVALNLGYMEENDGQLLEETLKVINSSSKNLAIVWDKMQSGEEMCALAREIRHSSLHTVCLQNSNLYLLPVLTKAIASSSLRALVLWRNQILHDGALALADLLKANSPLEALNIQSNDIGSKGICAIVDALQANTSLRALHLQDTIIGNDLCKRLAKALKMNTTLHELVLFGGAGTNDINIIAESLLVNTSLQVLRLPWQYMTGSRFASVRLLTEVIRKNTSLRSLRISMSNPDKADMRDLWRALQKNTTLLDFSLSTNDFLDGNDLQRVFSTNKTLRVFGIVGEMKTEGIRAIANAMKTNTTLRKLWLNVRVRDEGIRYIAEALKTNTTLRELDVSYNLISWEGICYIGSALEVNTGLRKLIIDPETEQHVTPIVNALKTNTTLTAIRFSCISHELQTLLERNRRIQSQNTSKLRTLLLYRRSFQAWRDRSRIFIAAREGRPMELRVRLRWGALAGGLSLKGPCDGKLMSPLQAAMKRGRQNCVDILLKTGYDLNVSID